MVFKRAVSDTREKGRKRDIDFKNHFLVMFTWSCSQLPKGALYIYIGLYYDSTQLGENFNIDFLLFPKWLFFQLYFGANIFEILEIWVISLMVSEHIG